MTDRCRHREECRRSPGRRLKQIVKRTVKGPVEVFDVPPSAGKAEHAKFQAALGPVGTTLPNELTARDADFTMITAFALRRSRLGEVGPGSKPTVPGPGLIVHQAARPCDL